MTFDQFLNMISNMVIRRVVNAGVGRLFRSASQTRTGRSETRARDRPAGDPAAPAEARAAAKRARQTARLLRRLR